LAFVMLSTSFPWVGWPFVPASNPRKRAVFALSLLMLAGCRGSASPAVRSVAASGYRLSAPADLAAVRSRHEVQASEGVKVVAVARFPRRRAARPGVWQRVVPELDRAAAELAKQQSGDVADSRTVAIAGRGARRYDIEYERDGKALVERIAFVLRGKTVSLLLFPYQ